MIVWCIIEASKILQGVAMKKIIVFSLVGAAGALSAVLPDNTCVYSGDTTRPSVSSVSVEWEGSLNTCWRSIVEDLMACRFRSCPIPGTVLIIK